MNGNIIPYEGGAESETILTDSGGNPLIAKRYNGFVELKAWNLRSVAFSGWTLPEKYRPPQNVDGAGWLWTVSPDLTYPCQVRINTNGSVNIWGRSSDGSTISGDNYRVFCTIVYMI